MKRADSFIVLIFLFFSVPGLFAQSAHFSIDAYKNFLANNQNLTYQELLSSYDAGKFESRLTNFPSTVSYLDSVVQKFHLTDYEVKLLKQNGFVVSERVLGTDVTYFLNSIFGADLPVFISTDMILKAFHQSYDLILKGVEISFLIPKLEELLTTMHSKLGELDKKYSSEPQLLQTLKDVDLYITVPLKILNSNSQPYYSDNITALNHIQNNIESLKLIGEPLFSTSPRKVDYSQFKPRGHYTDINFPQLANYFKAMIWLGRIELYLMKPVEPGEEPVKDEDILRQVIDSYFISELIEISKTKSIYDEFEKTIASFVGEQDNVTLDQLNSVYVSSNITGPKDFLNQQNLKRFQDTLATKSFSEQKILSQVLMSDPLDPATIKPASAFLLFGQRFVIDSYVTGNVVYDKINFNNKKITRMLPSTLDILFALGNSASAQLLKPDLEKYNYSTNLSALRYLIDSYEPDFWNASIYSLWLNSIRSLNPPKNRNNLPPFMQTAAWWQQKINTQLASWTELRHDNILYAKQSYSGVVICSYPYGYVEPIPEFYKSMISLCLKTVEKFNTLSVNLQKQKNFLNNFSSVMDTLKLIAEKELSSIPLSDQEKKFIQRVLFSTPAGCSTVFNGWYVDRLLYKDNYIGDINKSDQIVADYHTSVSDESGNIVGWVKHAGTGFLNLCVVVANLPGVGNVAFAGPVSSYYEYTSTNFLRLTDEEWFQTYLQKSLRPDWVNIYLADRQGQSRGSGGMLITGVEKNELENKLSENYEIRISNYPNPFNLETTISFSIPLSLTNNAAQLDVYDVNGRLIKKLINKELPAGNYLVRWNGMNEASQIVTSGIYFYNLKVGTFQKTGKMNLLK